MITPSDDELMFLRYLYLSSYIISWILLYFSFIYFKAYEEWDGTIPLQKDKSSKSFPNPASYQQQHACIVYLSCGELLADHSDLYVFL